MLLFSYLFQKPGCSRLEALNKSKGQVLQGYASPLGWAVGNTSSISSTSLQVDEMLCLPRYPYQEYGIVIRRVLPIQKLTPVTHPRPLSPWISSTPANPSFPRARFLCTQSV